jgi:hypothetical protein
MIKHPGLAPSFSYLLDKVIIAETSPIIFDYIRTPDGAFAIGSLDSTLQ